MIGSFARMQACQCCWGGSDCESVVNGLPNASTGCQRIVNALSNGLSTSCPRVANGLVNGLSTRSRRSTGCQRVINGLSTISQLAMPKRSQSSSNDPNHRPASRPDHWSCSSCNMHRTGSHQWYVLPAGATSVLRVAVV